MCSPASVALSGTGSARRVHQAAAAGSDAPPRLIRLPPGSCRGGTDECIAGRPAVARRVAGAGEQVTCEEIEDLPVLCRELLRPALTARRRCRGETVVFLRVGEPGQQGGSAGGV